MIPRNFLYSFAVAGLFMLLGMLLGCPDDVDERRDGSKAPPPPPPSPALVARAEDPRPSVVLIVLDTLRADAVSSYGVVEGTTPNLDRLAKRGIRYAKAYAPAPWTAPSHASLFSGLRVDQHGVGLDGLNIAPESLQMLAEDFSEAGYLTAGFSENMLLGPAFGLQQGFDSFVTNSLLEQIEAVNGGKPPPLFDLPTRLREWNRDRDKSLPFFLFINIFDSHAPYLVRDVNPWLPEDVGRDEAEYIKSRYPHVNRLCERAPKGRDLDVLHKLYLGNVAAADAKLGKVLRILDQGGDPGSRLVIATSDHGEHFGENRLMGHTFTIGNPALHIPMIISGIPDADPTVVEHPVELRQIRESLHCWALGEACPTGLLITDASTPEGSETSEPIISIYSDERGETPKWARRDHGVDDAELADRARSTCTAEDRVLGTMVSMLRYPIKVHWYENYAPALYDLSWDPREEFDQWERQPELALGLREELAEFVQSNITERDVATPTALSEEGVQTLKALGYYLD